MDPILGRLPDKVLLPAACRTVPGGWMSPGAYEIIQFGELDDESIVIILEERLRFQAGCENWLKMPLRLFLCCISKAVGWFWGLIVTNVVFLNDLLEARVIKLSELGQVMYIRNDVTQALLQTHKVILRRDTVLFSCPISGLTTLSWPSPFQTTYNLIDLLLAGFDSSDNLPGFDPLECPDLVELTLQLCNEPLFVIFVPRAPLRMGVLRGGSGLIRGFERRFQIFVRNVVVVIVF